MDPWGSGYRYAVSNVDVLADNIFELVSANGIRNAGIAAVQPDLFVCDDSTVLGNQIDCIAAGSNEVMINLAAVVISLGKDSGNIASNIQAENTDDFDAGVSGQGVCFFDPNRYGTVASSMMSSNGYRQINCFPG